jgi:hypothetical protein
VPLRCLALVATAALLATAGASASPLTFRVYADTGIGLTDVLWTGESFLYLENTANTIWQAGPTGAPLRQFASMPRQVEETRCVLSPGAHGFAADEVYCHAPDSTIYRISADGSSMTVFARLPETATTDGALAFDTVGRFGYTLLAATGRSGGAEPAGGTVYAIGADASVHRVGNYAGPGGADEIAVAPARFGPAAGSVVLTVDAGSSGRIVLMDAAGATNTIASLPDGPNPIAVISARAAHPRKVPSPGLYLTDTTSHKIFFAPASQLALHVGDLIVGSELKGLFWIVAARGRGYRTFRIAATLPGTSFNLEGATYIAG